MAVNKEQSLIHRTLQNSLSGTIAGIAVCLSGHPFDTLKVRLQTQPIHNPVYKGLTDCFLKTLKWEGIGGLYNGVGSPIVGQMFLRAVLFTSYYQITNLFAGSEHQGQRLKPGEYFIAGGCTGFIASLVDGPIELFKTKMQFQIIQSKSGDVTLYRNVFHAGYLITKTHGIHGFYQGLQATWCRNIPSYANFFGFIELTKDYLTPPGKTVKDLPMSALFISGGIGGFLYWVITYPTDVLKSLLQSDHSDPSKRKFRGYIHCAKHLYTQEGGILRFYRGFSPCLLRSVPANSIMIFVLEMCRKYFPQ